MIYVKLKSIFQIRSKNSYYDNIMYVHILFSKIYTVCMYDVEDQKSQQYFIFYRIAR